MTRLHFVCWPFSQSGLGRRQITVNLHIPDKFGDRCYKGKKCKRSEFSYCWREERYGHIHVMEQNRGFFSEQNTSGSLSMVTIPLLKRFSIYHKQSRWKVVLKFWEQFHSSIDTWPREGTEYCPHRVLLFGPLDSCNMILDRWINQGGSTVKNERACLWICGLSVEQLGTANFSLVIGSGEKSGQFILKRQGGMSNSSLAGNNVLSTMYRWTQFPFRICFLFYQDPFVKGYVGAWSQLILFCLR